jgi:hypothetical protein
MPFITKDLTFVKHACLWRSARSWGVSGLIFALVVGIGFAQTPVSQARTQSLEVRTLDDMFSDVAKLVPDFGGLFLSNDESALEVYLLDVSPRKVRAVEGAIARIFGRATIPKGRIKALKGQYGFLQLRQWYDRMTGSVLGIKGVSRTDIDEAKNRLRIGIESKGIEAQVVEQLGKLGIPREVVVIDVISLLVTAPDSAKEGSVRPLSLTLHMKVRPTEGGYQVIRNGLGGGAFTLGFNAARAGVAGFVTSTWATFSVWQQDGMGFFQAGPYDAVGTETVDPPGFSGAGFPCPKYTRCRYSAGAFVAYDQGVPSAQGVIGRTIGLTTTLMPNITVDPIKRLAVAGMPSVPYWAGYTLHKMGRETGWTSGKIGDTCANWSFPPNNLLLCQYSLSNVDTPMIADTTDFGAAVFRLRNFSSQGWEHVELYGMLWGVVIPLPARQFVFSPIGGVPLQQTGIQSPTDLGTLDYIPCNLPPGPPRC